MKVAVFSNKPDVLTFLTDANKEALHELVFFKHELNASSALFAAGFDAVCVFVNDKLDKQALQTLRDGGTKVVALRATGYNNIDLEAAKQFGITVVRVPAYSPYAVAEYTVGMLLSINRKIYRGYNRVREGNFSLDGLMGYDIHDKTIGIIGTGEIGSIVAKIMHGFGAHILATDKFQNQECLKLGVEYTDLKTLFTQSDIITLHCPLLPETKHLINEESIAQMKHGVTIINTGRGALIDTVAVIKALKSKKIEALALDVYEEEAGLFFEDLSDVIIQDDVFTRLLTFPNVLITGHQAFFTKEAVQNIATITIENLTALEKTGTCKNIIS
ncbi:MAG: 2-hydroxyacid dehydrogenase [Bdellovibrionota bacterium]|jgi:D-lactate dehydrogenase